MRGWDYLGEGVWVERREGLEWLLTALFWFSGTLAAIMALWWGISG